MRVRVYMRHVWRCGWKVVRQQPQESHMSNRYYELAELQNWCRGRCWLIRFKEVM